MKRKKLIFIIIGILVLISVVSSIFIILNFTKRKNEPDTKYVCTVKGKAYDYDMVEEVDIYRENNVLYQKTISKIVYVNEKMYLEDKNSSSSTSGKKFDDNELSVSIVTSKIKIENSSLKKTVDELLKKHYDCSEIVE